MDKRLVKRKYRKIKKRKRNMSFTLPTSPYKVISCDNPDHAHLNHQLHLFILKYKNHTVEVTKDGYLYHVRVDGGLPAINQYYSDMIDFVENSTQ